MNLHSCSAILINICILASVFVKGTCASPDSTKKDKFSLSIPKRITAAQRRILLDAIRNDYAKDIKAFFAENSSLDYQLIRFDGNVDEEPKIHGFTPMAAAIQLCKPSALLAILPLQFKHVWTINLAPGASPIELASSSCPELLVTWIKKKAENTQYSKLIDKPSSYQLYTIVRNLATAETPVEDVVLKQIHDWVSENLLPDYSFPVTDPQFTDLMDSFYGFMDTWVADKSFKLDFSLLQQLTDYTKGDTELNEDVALNHQMNQQKLIMIAISKATHARRADEIFADAIKVDINYFWSAPDALTPEQWNSLPDKTFLFLFMNRHRNIQSESEIMMPFVQKYTDPYLKNEEFNANLHMPRILLEFLYLLRDSISKVSFKREIVKDLIKKFYGSIASYYPRLDTILTASRHKSGKGSIQIIWTGNRKLIGEVYKENPDFECEIKGAYADDNPEQLETLFHDFSSHIGEFPLNPEDLRIVSLPYELSPLKTAIVMEKPKITKYLVSRSNFNIFAQNAWDLSAVEIAACYYPNMLGIVIGETEDCEFKLKVLNHLIRMYSRSQTVSLCKAPESAAIVIPDLMKKAKDCIDTIKKDVIAEGISKRWPVELIKALYASELYHDLEKYVNLALANRDINVIKFIFQEIGDKHSASMSRALAAFVRSSDGKLTLSSLNIFKFLMTHSKVDINAHDIPTSSTALTLAVQNGYTWMIQLLLLQPSLNVNAVSRGSLRTALHEAIAVFHSQPLEDKPFNRNAYANLVCSLFGLINIRCEDAFKDSLVRTKNDETLHGLMYQMSVFDWDPEKLSQDADKYIEALFNEKMAKMVKGALKIEETLKAVGKKNLMDFLKISVDELLKQESESYKDNVKTTINSLKLQYSYSMSIRHHLSSLLIELSCRLNRLVLKHANIFDDVNGMLLKHHESPSYESGLSHNLLLAHPAIDPRFFDSNGQDLLMTAKAKAVQVESEKIALNEVNRAHLRIMDAYHNYQFNTWAKNSVLAIILTLIIGSASWGLFRWTGIKVRRENHDTAAAVDTTS